MGRVNCLPPSAVLDIAGRALLDFRGFPTFETTKKKIDWWPNRTENMKVTIKFTISLLQITVNFAVCATKKIFLQAMCQ